MQRTHLLIGCLFLLTYTISAQKYTFSQPKMGSPFTITVSTRDTAGMHKVIVGAFGLVDQYNAVYSDYDTAAEAYVLSRAPSQNWLKVSREMMEILILSNQAYEQSEGRFDVTIGKLTDYWRAIRKATKQIDYDLIRSIVDSIGMDQVLLDVKARRIKKLSSQIQFDFGGIAKGYIADQVGKYLSKKGYNRYLIDAGGDLLAGKAPFGQKGWHIAVELPSSEQMDSTITIQRMGIATSGATYQHITIDGKKYSHILHPKTGLGSTELKNVTVIASSGARADWLATAASLLPVDVVRRLFNKDRFIICTAEDCTVIR